MFFSANHKVAKKKNVPCFLVSHVWPGSSIPEKWLTWKLKTNKPKTTCTVAAQRVYLLVSYHTLYHMILCSTYIYIYIDSIIVCIILWCSVVYSIVFCYVISCLIMVITLWCVMSSCLMYYTLSNYCVLYYITSCSTIPDDIRFHCSTLHHIIVYSSTYMYVWYGMIWSFYIAYVLYVTLCDHV